MSKYFKKLVGEKVYLSPWAGDEEEAELFTSWINDMRVSDGVKITHDQYSIQSETKFVREVAEKPDKSKHSFVIIDLATDKPIGNCMITEIDSIHRTAELGILIGEKDSRGKGNGSEALKLLLDYGFNYLNLHNIRLNYLSCNQAAAKCYEKVGFRPSGILREAFYLNGTYFDNVTADFLEDEFRTKYGDIIKNKNLGR